MKKTEITKNIPGGWYGNDAGFISASPKQGNVVIDAGKAVAAIKWLSRRAVITGTWTSKDINPGLCINYVLK